MSCLRVWLYDTFYPRFIGPALIIEYMTAAAAAAAAGISVDVIAHVRYQAYMADNNQPSQPTRCCEGSLTHSWEEGTAVAIDRSFVSCKLDGRWVFAHVSPRLRRTSRAGHTCRATPVVVLCANTGVSMVCCVCVRGYTTTHVECSQTSRRQHHSILCNSVNAVTTDVLAECISTRDLIIFHDSACH